MDRIDQSVANLLNIIREQDKQIQFYRLLADLILGGITLEGTSVVTIQNLEDLIDYLNEYDIDYLVLLIPGIFPKAYDREELDKSREAGTLEKWISEQWKDETIALAI
jgi:hypothetical protein